MLWFQVVTNPWLKRFIDLECFVLSGMLADDTITAEMAFMFMERNRPGSTIDYPMGGSAAIVDALVRGIEKNGGRVLLRSHVDSILVEGGRAAGVRLKARGSCGPQSEVRKRHVDQLRTSLHLMRFSPCSVYDCCTNHLQCWSCRWVLRLST